MSMNLQSLFGLGGRVALVTGASGGIGSALARGLAGAGAQVALNGRDHDRLNAVAASITESGGTAATFPADLSDPEAPAELVRRTVEQFGRLDILVNCAGMNRRMPILEVTPEVYRQILAANLDAVYFLSQAAARVMIGQGGGKIIHIGSLTSFIGLADVSVYGITKSALAQLTCTMAIEWATQNIQVNCLCPGFIATDLTAPLWANPTRSRWMLERIPMRRPGQPEDLAGLAVYLASPASDYTTGQTFTVDGGFLAGSQW